MRWRSWAVQNAHYALRTYSISLFPANSLFYAPSMRMIANKWVTPWCIFKLG